jgi:A/G-specific adenine glycosylase
MSSTSFKRAVWAHYEKHGRHALPWRNTRDPYRILVSEMMLQQTQVDRVIPFYRDFLKRFPNVRSLAKAPLRDVLVAWQGLGYNRRAKFLHEAAKAIAARHAGKVPRDYASLRALPGVGDYTARAVRTFAYGEPEALIETNIRTAFLRHFFPRKRSVTDASLMGHIAGAADKKHPREWHWALMDYGAHLKRTEGNASRRSAHHKKQKPFKGSGREVRGAIIRELAKGRLSRAALGARLAFPSERVDAQLEALREEGFIMKRGRYFALGS